MVIKVCCAFLMCGMLYCDAMQDIHTDLVSKQNEDQSISGLYSAVMQLKQTRSSRKISDLLSKSTQNFLEVLHFLDRIASKDTNLKNMDVVELDKLYIRATNSIEQYVEMCQLFKKQYPSSGVSKKVDEILREGKNRERPNQQKID